jgi:hypothetical protein
MSGMRYPQHPRPARRTHDLRLYRNRDGPDSTGGANTAMEAAMSQDLTAEQRAAALQHWCTLIMRECCDLAALERLIARAEQDRDVRADAQLQSLVRDEFERRRAALQREGQHAQETLRSGVPTHQQPSETPQACSDDLESFLDELNLEPAPPPSAPPEPPPPDPDRVAFNELKEAFGGALKASDEHAAQTACAELRSLHERRADIVSATDLNKFEQQITQLHEQLEEHRTQIAALTEQAQTAAHQGDEAHTIKLLRRLTAIHATHPHLLDEAELEKARRDVAQASEGHDDRQITRELIQRERDVTAEMKQLAEAVSAYHRALFHQPEDLVEQRRAARRYLRVLREVRLHEKDWLTDFVLELGDVLANWSTPPAGAEQQIDRFLEKLRMSLRRIQKQMGEIDRASDT